MTTDAMIRNTDEYRDHPDGQSAAHCWLADRAAVRALIDALPRCGYCGAEPLMRKKATHMVDGRCDSDSNASYRDVEYAPALRALLERVMHWNGEK